MFGQRDRLPHYQRVHFRKAPLELCLAQIRFPALLSFGQAAVRDAFRRDLRDDYPLFAAEQALGVTVTPQGINSTAIGDQLRFASLDGNWAVVLTNELVSLEVRRYTSIDEFVARLRYVLERVNTHFDPTYRTRLGLRYINEIRLQSEGGSYETWQRLLNPDLLGIAGRGILGGTVEQTISEVRTRRDDGVLLFRHGFLTGTTVAPPPQAIGRFTAKSGPFYLLDFDYYDDVPVPFSADLDQPLMAYHDVIYRLFMWCIGQGGDLYDVLEGERS